MVLLLVHQVRGSHNIVKRCRGNGSSWGSQLNNSDYDPELELHIGYCKFYIDVDNAICFFMICSYFFRRKWWSSTSLLVWRVSMWANVGMKPPKLWCYGKLFIVFFEQKVIVCYVVFLWYVFLLLCLCFLWYLFMDFLQHRYDMVWSLAETRITLC